MTSLVEQTSDLLTAAEGVFAGTPVLTELERLRSRLQEPLRVAIAGKVKAGKSTLLNALVGELLAPTGTGECTKVVTWYRDGHTYEVLVHPTDGSPAFQARFHRDDGAIEVDLAGRSATSIDRIDVMWPSGGLRELSLIDTPGFDSLTQGVASRAFEFLDPADDDTPADAVLYLMKHIHASDVRLLEAFHDDTVASPNPVNAIAVLSRADEIGVGRSNSMDSAARIATRLGDDPRLRRLVQMILPIAGLLAETAQTLTEAEYRDVASLAAVDDLDLMLLSADRFVEARPETPLTSIERQRMLDRFGIFGVRAAVQLIASGAAPTSRRLSELLLELSGLNELRSVLSTLFVERADVLKARSGLLGIERLCNENGSVPGVIELRNDLERVMSTAHPFNELNTMAAIRGGWVSGSAKQLTELERILGCGGTTPQQRLGLPPTADSAEIRSAAATEHSRLQRAAENPLTTHDLATAIRVAIRSLEGVLVAVA